MSITSAAIEKNRVTAVALLIIIIGGLMAYKNLPQAEDPGFIIRTALVATYLPGASPERVEMLVTDKLEKVIQEIPELDNVESESKTGASIIYVNIKEQYKRMRPIWDSLRRKIDRSRAELPEGVVGPFVNDEFGDVFGIILTVTGEGFSYAELKEVADQVRDEMLSLSEVAKVEIYGAQGERIFIEYNDARLAELNLSAYQLQQILEGQNIIIPGGSIQIGHERIVLEPSGNFESLEDLRRTVINLPHRREVIYLEDLVDISRGYIDPPQTKMRASGVPCLGLAVSMREKGNIIRLGRQVRALVVQIQGLYPIGVEFDLVAFQPEQVNRKIHEFIRSLLQSILIVSVVLLIFLGLRTGFLVASLIPTTMLMTLLIMWILNIGLNQVSLASLIIALGMLVDNAIVMSESIMVRMERGEGAVKAAIDSAGELRLSLLTASLTTAAAFLPIFLAESITGEYTTPLFKVVTITLICSWVLALTMTPLLCVCFLKVKVDKKKDPYHTGFYVRYRNFLLRLLRRPYLTIMVIVIAFSLAMFGFRYLPVIFFPPSDRPLFTAELELPNGTAIERTEEVVKEIEEFIKKEITVNFDNQQGVTNWASFIGQGAPRFVLTYSPKVRRAEYAFMIINTTSREVIDQIIPKMRTFCFERFPDLKATIRPLELGPPVGTPIAVRISGKDPVTLFEMVAQVKRKIRSIPGTTNVSDDWGARTKKLLVKVNQPRARRAGVSSRDVAISLQTVLCGFETTQYREEDKIIPVTFRSIAADRQDIGKLETLNIYAQATGQSVPLKQIADIEVVWQAARILRKDRFKTITVEADVSSGFTANEVNAALIPWLEAQSADWGLGYRYEIGGEAEESDKANQSILAKLPIAAFIIILLLVAQFNSIRRTFIILVTIPLSLIGVVIGLLAVRSFFGFMTLLGIISLAGIVVNNAIVLLGRIKFEITQNGLNPAQAIVESTQRRLRPILLTTGTTIAGLFPLWLGGGPMWQPMAITIIFGLLLATVLTLCMVPVLYAILFRVKFKEFRY